MFKIIEKFVNKYNISSKKLMVAFSGGYDSTVLLNILLKCREKYNFELFAIHLNHNWRGLESDKEEIFCKNFCKKNNITFFSKKLEKNSAKNELEAREARYNYFKELYTKNNIDYLLTAHTKSDNAETMIFRLAKGTGIKGLKGICEDVEYFGMKILRPLISISRTQIEQYIKENDLEVNFDSSNKNKKYKRNKIRLDIIPHFKELSDSFEDNILNTSKIAQFYDKTVSDFIEELQIFNKNKVKRRIFLEQSYEFQNIILHKFLNNNEIEMNFKQIQLLLDEIKSKIPKSGKYFSLSLNKFVLIKNDFFEVIEQKCNNINDYSFSISDVDKKVIKFPNGTKNYIYANKSILKEPLKLRKRQDGDIFQPFGMQGKMKLKKFLSEKAIPKFERDNLILLTNADNDILWIYPLATSELVKVNDDNYVRIELKHDSNL